MNYSVYYDVSLLYNPSLLPSVSSVVVYTRGGSLYPRW